VTYSIVARDPETGDLGVAVQSHFFAVGVVVGWAEAGVGAVATQSLVEPAYGPRGLELMRRGRGAGEALSELLAADAEAEVRQVGMVDAGGGVAVHTGERCIEAAGHRSGDGWSVQANMMRSEGVPGAMAEVFQDASGPLAERMLAALDAAEAQGGDIRGRQSASLLVKAGSASGRRFEDVGVDLRVDDHPDPLGELRRLLTLKRAYDRVEAGDELAGRGDMDGALREYAAAHEIQPDNVELAFWHGVTLAGAGREDEARPLLHKAFAEHDGWRELLLRLPAAGLFPEDRELIERLLDAGGGVG
jgi:uncharacterized Ntn-hydrolase superfamily protein